MQIMDMTALELGRKIKEKEVSVKEAVQARLELPLFRQTLNAAFAPHQIRTWRLDPTGGMAAEQTNLIERGAEQSEE